MLSKISRFFLKFYRNSSVGNSPEDVRSVIILSKFYRNSHEVPLGVCQNFYQISIEVLVGELAAATSRNVLGTGVISSGWVQVARRHKVTHFFFLVNGSRRPDGTESHMYRLFWVGHGGRAAQSRTCVVS